MKTLVLDHHTFANSGWEQQVGFELNIARLEAIQADKRLDEKVAKRKDIYFRVYGIDGELEVNLGYTGNPVAWSQYSNGWKLENLRFEPMLKEAK